MSWYSKKIAQSTNPADTGEGWQEGSEETFGDVQRYLYDSYVCRTYITKLAGKKITISLSLLHLQEGISMWQDFWRFGTDEEALARKIYEQIKKAMQEVYDHFKTNTIPNNLLYTFMREAVREIAPEHKPSTRIPHLDWNRKNPKVTDWRHSIYGNRYPESDGF
jgi:hypothetical protein